MTARARLGILAVLPLLLGGRVASAQLGSGEQKCELAAAAALGKLAVARAKCVAKCDQGRQAGSVPATDCAPPYGGATLGCINTVAAKAAATIDKKCATACPSCYGGGNCSAFRTSRIGNVGTVLDAQYPIVFCTQPGLTTAEAKCRQAAALEATKFAAALAKCYSKCHLLEFKAKIPIGSCVPPTPFDSKTAACKASAIQKTTAAIATKCATPPPCLAPNLGTLVQPLAANLTEDFDPQVFCYSPSGAFLDQP